MLNGLECRIKTIAYTRHWGGAVLQALNYAIVKAPLPLQCCAMRSARSALRCDARSTGMGK